MVRLLGLTAAAATLALAVAPPASAASRKVGLGDFRWSSERVEVALGESVTWVWTGPDTSHSVTGDAVDSDPGRARPRHPVGDRFTARFDRAGTFAFACRLHPGVRGVVEVLDVPGDPSAPSPDPEPRLRPDRRAPDLRGLRVTRGRVLRFSLDEPARVAIDLVRRRAGRGGLVDAREVRGHPGFNAVRLRDARTPGRYTALVRATDARGNRTRERAVRFIVR